MTLDRNRLKETAKILGYNIEFDSKESGIVNADGRLIKYDDILIVYHAPPLVSENKNYKRMILKGEI